MAYIHALGPRIVEMLNRMSQHLEDVQFLSKSRYELLVSGVDALESLVSIAEAEKSKYFPCIKRCHDDDIIS